MHPTAMSGIVSLLWQGKDCVPLSDFRSVKTASLEKDRYFVNIIGLIHDSKKSVIQSNLAKNLFQELVSC